MRTIAIVSRKGGTGKTATSQTLGARLKKKKKKVLFVDLDSQANLSYSLAATLEQPGSMELLTGRLKIQDTIQRTDQGDVIIGSEDLAAADKVIDGTGKEFKLKEALEEVQEQYDFAIIDTPAATGVLTINALTAADTIILPVQAEIYSMQGMGQLKKTIDAVRKYCNADLQIDGVLITRYNSRTIISKDMLASMEEAAKTLETKVYKSQIRECTAMKEAQALQQSIFDYAPKSNAASDYKAFVDEFLRNV